MSVTSLHDWRIGAMSPAEREAVAERELRALQAARAEDEARRERAEAHSSPRPPPAWIDQAMQEMDFAIARSKRARGIYPAERLPSPRAKVGISGGQAMANNRRERCEAIANGAWGVDEELYAAARAAADASPMREATRATAKLRTIMIRKGMIDG